MRSVSTVKKSEKDDLTRRRAPRAAHGHALPRRGGLELGHVLSEGAEEVLLDGAERLELVGEVGGTRGLVLDELIDQTIGDGGQRGLTLLELVLVLEGNGD